MSYKFFTISEYVNEAHHISASEKIIQGKTDFHMHEFFEIEFIIDGSGKHIINGHEYDLSRSDIYLLTPGTFHKLVCTPELKLINIMFDESVISSALISELLAKSSDYLIRLDDDEFFDTYMLAAQLIDNIRSNSDYTGLFITNLINCIIIKIIRGEHKARQGDRIKHSALLNNAMRHLYNNFKDNPSLEKTAAISGYSPNYFSKIFTELTGKGYVDFLNTLKVTHAKMLLSSTDKTVSEIAFTCGFSSLSNFYRVFKNELSIAPLDYRKQITANKK